MTIAISVTGRAVIKIRDILSKNPDKNLLRVSVLGGGCSGFQYKFDVDDKTYDDDHIITKDNISIVIDSISVNYMEGAEIDFVDDLIGSYFKINNPLATSSCGCGTSFSI